MVTTNWSVVIGDNRRAVENFVNGQSLRTTIKQLGNMDARSELYRTEGVVPVSNLRTRARKALARR